MFSSLEKQSGIRAKNSLVLVFINIIIYILLLLAENDIPNFDKVTFLVSKINELIYEGEYYRIMTSLFLYNNFFEFAFSLFGIYFFGRTIEIASGGSEVYLIYLLSGLFANIVGISFGNIDYVISFLPIFGLMGAGIIFTNKITGWRKHLSDAENSFLTKARTDFIKSVIIFLIFAFIYSFNMSPLSSFTVYLAGLLIGMTLGFLIKLINDDYHFRVVFEHFSFIITALIIGFFVLPIEENLCRDFFALSQTYELENGLEISYPKYFEVKQSQDKRVLLESQYFPFVISTIPDAYFSSESTFDEIYEQNEYFKQFIGDKKILFHNVATINDNKAYELRYSYTEDEKIIVEMLFANFENNIRQGLMYQAKAKHFEDYHDLFLSVFSSLKFDK